MSDDMMAAAAVSAQHTADNAGFCEGCGHSVPIHGHATGCGHARSAAAAVSGEQA